MTIQTVVLAWINSDPNSEFYRKPCSVVWLREADASDITRATLYAAKAGYQIFVYPTSEPDPLGRGRREIAKSTS